MPRQFLPTLTRSPRLDVKPVEPGDAKVVLSDYYNALTAAGLYSTRRARPWPVERAVAEAYERLVWVFKAVEAVSGHASRLPVHLKDGEDVLDDHPLYRVLNKRANPLETGRQFRKRLSAQILLSKRGAFVELTRSRGGDIVRMDLLPPGRTRPIPGTGQTLIDHYQVWRADGSKTEIPPENVRWFREPHPLDPYCGVTPLEAAGLSVELDFFARLYNKSFMANDARPGGILGVDGEMGTDDMAEVESRFAPGPVDAGKLTVINGKISYVDLAARPRDAQYEVTAKSAKSEILTAFGVPESVIGDASGRTFDNADAELYNFWTITMTPHLDLLATGFDEDSEDELETFVDTTEVEVLQRAKIARRAEMREEFTSGLVSPDEYREFAGYDRVDTAQTRALYIPTGSTPVPTSEKDAVEFGLGNADPPLQNPPPIDGAQDTPPGPDGQQPPAEPPPDGSPPPPSGPNTGREPPRPPGRTPQPRAAAAPARKALRLIVTKADGAGHRTRRRSPAGDAAGDAEEAVSEPDGKAHDKLEAALAAALAALAVRLTERALARISSPKSRKGTRHWVAQYDVDTRIGVKALDAAKAVNAAAWRTEAARTVTPIVEAAARAAADALLTDLAGDAATGTDVDTLTGQIVDLVAESADRQAQHLAILIGQADKQGRDIDEITAMVREHEKHLSGWADRIAVTAATATTAGARDAAAAALADTDPNLAIQRMWLTKMDDKVRADHRKTHGHHEPLGEPFHVGDAVLRYPGDPFGPPGQTINCRCRLQHRARRTGQYAATPEGEVTAAEPLAATGTEGKTYRLQVKHPRWDPGEHPRDRRGQFADEPGGGPSLPDGVELVPGDGPATAVRVNGQVVGSIYPANFLGGDDTGWWATGTGVGAPKRFDSQEEAVAHVSTLEAVKPVAPPPYDRAPASLPTEASSAGTPIFTGETGLRLVKPAELDIDRSSPEGEAVRQYTSDYFGPLNNQLRGQQFGEVSDDFIDPADAQRLIQGMDAAFDKLEPTRYEISTRRGVAHGDDIFGPVGSKVGDPWTDRAYMSTSPTRSFFGDTSVVIELPAGSKVMRTGHLSSHGGEDELLLPRDSRFVIVDDQVKQQRRTVTLRLAPPG